MVSLIVQWQPNGCYFGGIELRYIPAVIGTPHRSSHVLKTLETRIGGSPTGLPEVDWPKCSHCGRDMDFLIQLDLHFPVRVSDRFQFAYLFFCNGFYDNPNGEQCPSQDCIWGANCVRLISDPNPAHYVEGRGVVRYADFALDLRVRDEPIVDTQDYSLDDAAFLDRDGNEDIRHDTSCTIKIGGTPVFMQTPDSVACPSCGGRTRCIAQIGSELENPGYGGYSFNVAGGQFYVFKCSAECSATGAAMYLQLD